jgi:hypothetical protein
MQLSDRLAAAKAAVRKELGINDAHSSNLTFRTTVAAPRHAIRFQRWNFKRLIHSVGATQQR